MWEFCTDELKKSLDLGREFETKQREAEDNKNLKGGDVEMKDEEKKEEETKEEAEAPKKLVGDAAKAAMKNEQIKKHDEDLYRPHD